MYQITAVMQEGELCNIPIKTVGSIREFTSFLKRQPKDNSYSLSTVVITTIVDPMIYEGGGGRSTI